MVQRISAAVNRQTQSFNLRDDDDDRRIDGTPQKTKVVFIQVPPPQAYIAPRSNPNSIAKFAGDVLNFTAMILFSGYLLKLAHSGIEKFGKQIQRQKLLDTPLKQMWQGLKDNLNPDNLGTNGKALFNQFDKAIQKAAQDGQPLTLRDLQNNPQKLLGFLDPAREFVKEIFGTQEKAPVQSSRSAEQNIQNNNTPDNLKGLETVLSQFVNLYSNNQLNEIPESLFFALAKEVKAHEDKIPKNGNGNWFHFREKLDLTLEDWRTQPENERKQFLDRAGFLLISLKEPAELNSGENNSSPEHPPEANSNSNPKQFDLEELKGFIANVIKEIFGTAETTPKTGPVQINIE